MAKKQQPKLSYGPNMGLIAGEAQVAKSEAGLSNSVGAFAQGFMGVFGAFQKQEEERAAKMEAYNAQVPSVEQLNFIKDPSNKQIVRTFLNKQRDEYSRLAEIFEKTKDRGVRDKMEEIKFSLVNLNDQIKVFNEDKNEYRTAFDENQLADGRTFNADFFTNAFTNNGELGISENGDMGFNIEGKNYLYKDNAGKWNNKNNISEEFQLSMYSKMLARGESGKEFYSENVYNAINNNLKSTGTEGIQALATTDLTGDNSTMSFEQQWASGSLDKKFYQNRKKGTDTSWMFESKNSAELRGLMSTYYTDVMKDGHGKGRSNYSQKTDGGDQYKNYTVDGYTGVNYSTAKAQYDNMLVPGKINYDRKGSYKYISDGKGNTDVYIQKNTGKYEKIETIPTNDALARRGLDLFGEGYITPKTDIKFIDFNNDRDGDGIPNNIDREPDNPNN